MGLRHLRAVRPDRAVAHVLSTTCRCRAVARAAAGRQHARSERDPVGRPAHVARTRQPTTHRFVRRCLNGSDTSCVPSDVFRTGTLTPQLLNYLVDAGLPDRHDVRNGSSTPRSTANSTWRARGRSRAVGGIRWRIPPREARTPRRPRVLDRRPRRPRRPDAVGGRFLRRLGSVRRSLDTARRRRAVGEAARDQRRLPHFGLRNGRHHAHLQVRRFVVADRRRPLPRFVPTRGSRAERRRVVRHVVPGLWGGQDPCASTTSAGPAFNAAQCANWSDGGSDRELRARARTSRVRRHSARAVLGQLQPEA